MAKKRKKMSYDDMLRQDVANIIDGPERNQPKSRPEQAQQDALEKCIPTWYAKGENPPAPPKKAKKKKAAKSKKKIKADAEQALNEMENAD